MSWIILVVITVILEAVIMFIDNFVSDVYFKKTESVSQKIFYGYFYLITGLLILIITGFSFANADFGTLGIIILSGAISSFASIFYYKALEIEESTNLGIFIQLAPVFYLIIGWLFHGNQFSLTQLIASLVILTAPITIVLTTRKKSRKTKIKAIFYAIIYVLIAVIANYIFVAANTNSMSFISAIAFLFLGKGISNMAIVYSRPKLTKRFRTVIKKHKFKVLAPLLINAIFDDVRDFTYRAALVFAPSVALASATTDSAIPIVIFFLGIIFTLIWPKFGREKLDRKSVLAHLLATVLVVIGVILLQL